MKVARVLLPSSSRPRVALERDGALYDVESLERRLGASVEVPCAASDFHGRVVAMGLAGLRELDAALLRGLRPAEARVDRGMPRRLAPCETDRAALVHVDVPAYPSEAPSVRLGWGRGLAGDGELVGLPREELRPKVELRLAMVLGEDVHNVDFRDARAAILGYALHLDWRALSDEARAPQSTTRGLVGQFGPHLVAADAVGRLPSLRAEVVVRERSHALGPLDRLALGPELALVHASRRFALVAGDVVTWGPLATDGVLDELAFHDRVEFAVERIGTLRGAAVLLR